jgi:hypothetical protein
MPPTPDAPLPTKKPKSKVLIGLLSCGALFVLVLIIGALSPKKETAATGSTTTTAAETGATTTASATPATDAPTTAPPATAPPTTAAPAETAGQKNAKKSAASYLKMKGFSRQGLIDQLTSEYGDKYSVEDATYAVDSLNADWNEQAVRSAQSYLKMKGFSRQALIDQLSSQYADKFTPEQAAAGADGAGL